MQRSTGHRIGYISRMSHKYFKEKFDALGIGAGQIFVLRNLFQQDGVHQEALVSNCQVHKANVTRAINRLEENGLVCRKADPEDKRAKLIYVTDKGKNIENEFFKIFRSWSDMLTLGFTEEEKELVLSLLDRMAANVEPHYGDIEEF